MLVATASWRGQLCGQFVAKRRHARSSDAKSRMRRHVMSKAAPLARFTSRSPPALARSRSLGSGGTPLQRRPAVTSKPRVTSSIERAQIMSLYSPRAAHKAKSTIRARNAALSRFRGSTNPPRLPPSPCQPFRRTNRIHSLPYGSGESPESLNSDGAGWAPCSEIKNPPGGWPSGARSNGDYMRGTVCPAAGKGTREPQSVVHRR